MREILKDLQVGLILIMSFLKKVFYTLTGLIYKLHENYIEGQYMEPYKTFLVPFDTTKLNLL